jgi:hypothetical protein
MLDNFISLDLLTSHNVERLFKNLSKLGIIDEIKNIKKLIKYKFDGKFLSEIVSIEDLITLDMSYEELNILFEKITFMQTYGVNKLLLQKKKKKINIIPNHYYEIRLTNILSQAKSEKCAYKKLLKPFLHICQETKSVPNAKPIPL